MFIKLCLQLLLKPQRVTAISCLFYNHSLWLQVLYFCLMNSVFFMNNFAHFHAYQILGKRKHEKHTSNVTIIPESTEDFHSEISYSSIRKRRRHPAQSLLHPPPLPTPINPFPIHTPPCTPHHSKISHLNTPSTSRTFVQTSSQSLENSDHREACFFLYFRFAIIYTRI